MGAASRRRGQAPAGAGREQRKTAAAGSSVDPPRERAKALSYCQPRRGGGVKVLLRYFLTEKVTKRSCPLAGAMVRWDW